MSGNGDEELSDAWVEDELDLSLPPLGDGPEQLGPQAGEQSEHELGTLAESETLDLDDETGAKDPIDPGLLADLMETHPDDEQSFLVDDREAAGLESEPGEGGAADEADAEYGWLTDSSPSGLDDYVSDLSLGSEDSAVLDDGGVLSIEELLGDDGLPLNGEE